VSTQAPSGALAALLLFAPITALAQSIRFQVAPESPAGVTPFAHTSGDFNADGVPDLVITDDGPAAAAVLLGTGDGTFSPPTVFGDMPGRIKWVAAADFNGDGRDDVAIASWEYGSVSVFLSSGSGLFGPETRLFVASNCRSIVCADFDLDTWPDIAVGTNSRTIVIVRNVSGTGFTSGGDFDVGGPPESVVAGAFSGDTYPDLAVAAGSTKVLLNLGNGSFGPYQEVGGGGYSVAAADLDQDGHLDLLTADWGHNTALGLLRNTGSGAFTYASGPDLGSWVTCIAAADLNDDDAPDIVLHKESNTATVLFNLGNLAFGNPLSYGVGRNAKSITTVDFNLDGTPDLTATDYINRSVALLRNVFGGVFAGRRDSRLRSNAIAVSSADFDEDGNVDALVGSGLPDVEILWNSGGGYLTKKTALALETDWLPLSTWCISPADVVGDSRVDVVVGASNSDNGPSRIVILENLGNRAFAAPVAFDVGIVPLQLALADVDADGMFDVVVLGRAYGQQYPYSLGWLRNLGSGNFATWSAIFTGSSETLHSLAVADVNGDGLEDLGTTSYFETMIFRNGGSGSFDAPDLYPNPMAGSLTLGPLFIDANNDSHVDMVVAKVVEQQLITFFNQGNGHFGPSIASPTPQRPVGLCAGDFDLDGRVDVATQNPWSDEIVVLAGAGDGTFTTVASYVMASSPTSVGAADFDGDGILDLMTGAVYSLSVIDNRSLAPTDVQSGAPGPVPSLVEI